MKKKRGEVLIETLCLILKVEKKKKIQNGLVIKYSLKFIFFVIFRKFACKQLITISSIFYYTFKRKKNSGQKISD